MKPTIALFLLTSFSLTVSAQENRTDENRYTWDGKQTLPFSGYVILKSGKQMDGLLSLKGKPNEVKLIVLVVNGKVIEFKPESLKAYGINAEPLVNESPEDLYEWKSAGEVMGKIVENTKSRPGFVVLTNGNRIEGELQLRRTEGVLDLIKIKSDQGKGKYELSEVNRFGIILTIKEVTNDGKKVRKDWALNFHRGYVLNESGEKKEGFIAFKNASVPNSLKPLENAVYTGIYFTETQEGILSNLETSDIVEVQKQSGDSILKYEAMGDGSFMFQVNKSTSNVKLAGRMFQKGSIQIVGGTIEQGEVAQVFLKGSQYVENIRFRYPTGAVRILSTEEVERFTQTIEGKKYTFIREKKYFVQLEFEGNVFLLYRNPFPTTVNVTKTNLAKTTIMVGGHVATAEMAKSGDRKGGWESNADSVLNSMSKEQLQSLQLEFLSRYEGSEEKFMEHASEANTRYYNAIKIKLMEKELSENVKVMNKEWIVFNKKTNESSIVIQEKYKSTIETILMGCEDYVIMDKKTQESYTKEFENLIKAIELLEKCFK